jgi:hypothetical protein
MFANSKFRMKKKLHPGKLQILIITKLCKMFKLYKVLYIKLKKMTYRRLNN